MDVTAGGTRHSLKSVLFIRGAAVGRPSLNVERVLGHRYMKAVIGTENTGSLKGAQLRETT